MGGDGVHFNPNLPPCDTPVVWVTKSRHTFADVSLMNGLESLGLMPWRCPLVAIDYDFEKDDVSSLSDIGGVVFTSVHGVDGFLTWCKNTPICIPNGVRKFMDSAVVYAVGDTTGAYCEQMGFKHVVRGGGTAENLIKTIQYNDFNKQKKLLYARGVQVACDLGSALAKLGFETVEKIVYKNTYTPVLPPECVIYLQHTPPWGITVQSVKTAQTLAFLAEQHNLGDVLAGVHLFCASTAICDVFGTRTPQKTHVVGANGGDSLLTAIGSVVE